MILKVFTVYDSKAEAYYQPHYNSATGAAIRNFTDAVNNSETTFSKHPEDYTLFEIGTFDDGKGTVTMHHAHVSLCVGNEVAVLNLTNPMYADLSESADRELNGAKV